MELVQKSFHEYAMKHSYKVEVLIQQSLNGKLVLPIEYNFGLGHAIQKVSKERLFNILIHPARWHNVAFYCLIVTSSIGAYFVTPYIYPNHDQAKCHTKSHSNNCSDIKTAKSSDTTDMESISYPMKSVMINKTQCELY
jgi:hypothetical protein